MKKKYVFIDTELAKKLCGYTGRMIAYNANEGNIKIDKHEMDVNLKEHYLAVVELHKQLINAGIIKYEQSKSN